MNSAESISEHFLRSQEQQWLDTFHTNVAGQYFMSMAFLPLLAKGTSQTPGYSSQIVNVTSISGAMKGSSGGQFAYASSKAAFTHMGRMLATTFKDVKVRVNTIAPGVFPSEMTAGDSGEDNKSQLNMDMSNPAGRPGHDTDMGASILFLASKGGVFYNDQVLYPDGGRGFPAAMSMACADRTRNHSRTACVQVGSANVAPTGYRLRPPFNLSWVTLRSK